MGRPWLRVAASLLFLFSTVEASAAGISVPAGAQLRIGDGAIRLAEGNFAIAAGGRVEGGSGRIELGGDWLNFGDFVAGNGRVTFVDGISPVAIIGSTHFHGLVLQSATGKRFRFQAGSTQFVGGLLRIQGTPAAPLQIESAAVGQVANLDLAVGGQQEIAAVGVSDVHATGQPLAPNQSNQGGRGNATGWFGQANLASVIPVPAANAGLLLALALLLPGLGLWVGSGRMRRAIGGHQ